MHAPLAPLDPPSRPKAPLIVTVHRLLSVKRKIIYQNICHVFLNFAITRNEMILKLYLSFVVYSFMNADAEENKLKFKIQMTPPPPPVLRATTSPVVWYTHRLPRHPSSPDSLPSRKHISTSSSNFHSLHLFFSSSLMSVIDASKRCDDVTAFSDHEVTIRTNKRPMRSGVCGVSISVRHSPATH